EDTSIPVDSWVPSTPKNKVSLWTRYVIPSGLFKGLGFSAGGSIYTRQAGDDNNTYFVSGYGLLNLNVSYRRARYELLVNVNNALDKDYVRGALGTLFVVRGEPRNYRFTLRYSL